MQPHKLCRGARLCLNELRSHLHGKNYCWIRQIIVAENMGVDVRSVKRYYAALVAAGEIKIHRRGDGQSALVTVTSAVTSAVTSETLQKPLQPADGTSVVGENVTSETPYRKPELNLKKTTKYQSEFPVQEHLGTASAPTEPSPFEKAQADAIGNAVRVCGFEPTPDLLAKLERKRRHYGVTGFRVATEITKAFKRVQGTSNEPDRQKPGWITVVVETALKPSPRDETEGRSASSETPTAYCPKWRPAPRTPAIQNQPGPISEHVADVDRVESAAIATTRATEPDPGQTAQREQPAPIGTAPKAGASEEGHQWTPATIATTDRASTEEKPNQFQSMTSNTSPPPAPACLRCGSDGVVNGTVSWCDCERGKQRRCAHPGYIDYLIRTGWRPALRPRPPQSESGPLREVATAAGGVR